MSVSSIGIIPEHSSYSCFGRSSNGGVNVHPEFAWTPSCIGVCCALGGIVRRQHSGHPVAKIAVNTEIPVSLGAT